MPGIEVFPEQALEEALAATLGERPHQTGDRQVSILWQTGDTKKLYPVALLLESREPLIRQAMLPRPTPVSASSVTLFDAVPTVFSAPVSDGFARIIVGSSFFSMLFVF